MKSNDCFWKPYLPLLSICISLPLPIFWKYFKYFPLSCVYIICDFDILFSKNSKKFYFHCFSAKFGGRLLNMIKNIFFQSHFLFIQ